MTTIYEKWRQASQRLEAKDMYIWLADNSEEIERAGYFIHPSQTEVGRKLKVLSK